MINFGAISLVILGVGVLGMGVTYVVGKILHVQVNRPPSIATNYMRNEAGRKVFEDGQHMVRKGKFSIPQLRRIAGGDPQPIDDVRDEQAREREEEVRKSLARRRIAEEEQARNDGFYQQMIAPVPDSSTSSHGNSKQPTNF